MRASITRGPILEILILIVILAIIPLALMGNAYYELLAATVVLFSSMVVAWNIIGGYAGQLDLGAYAYMGVGGIVTAELWMKAGIPPLLGIFVGGAVSALIAILIGIPTFRFGIKEVWYALLTAALVVIFNNISRLLMGPFDYYLPPTTGFVYLKFNSYVIVYAIAASFLIIAFLVNFFVERSKMGYYLKAIREDELAAEMVGIDTRRYKLYALLLYSFLLGVMGYIYIVIAASYSYRIFDSSASLSIAIMGIIGGLGSVEGGIISSMVLRSLGEYFRSTFGSSLPGLDLLLYGAVLILIGIFQPEGISSLINKLLKRKG
ncbi:MAG TPA: branched-chain amino acid ABC transporter permease [Fervidicoccus fontis]|uniref:Branched-chain amino acid ABC transporter permease n=1 Tax=Fervidicoccus fontis TaxID=683846 RepID=A0A7C2YLR3_9CREN|nr:branched-chain amino acid ABC transporter permease [Fervidicoccus fontis]